MLRKLLNGLGYVRLETAENWVSAKNKRIRVLGQEMEALVERTNRAQAKTARLTNQIIILNNRIKALEQAHKTRVVNGGGKEH